MRFGIVVVATPEAPVHAAAAEAFGFDSGWIFDSHMVHSDVFVIMTLCAQQTRRMTLGTGVAVAPSRIAPVTASTVATLNQLFPGRVMLGIGTGNSGRRLMGLPPMPLREFHEYLVVLKGLLRGQEVEYRHAGSTRPIRFVHPERGMINLDGPIPVMLGVFGPKGLDLAGSLGDGLVTFWGGPEDIRTARRRLDAAAAKAGRDLAAEGFRTVCFHNVYVTRPGERVDSEEARMAMGPAICSALRYNIHSGSLTVDEAGRAAGVPAALRPAVERFLAWMKKEGIDPDRDYGRFYENYFLRPRKEHLDLLDADTIRALAIAGPPDECVARLRALEESGVTDLAVVLGGNANELMRRFSASVMRHWQ